MTSSFKPLAKLEPGDDVILKYIGKYEGLIGCIIVRPVDSIKAGKIKAHGLMFRPDRQYKCGHEWQLLEPEPENIMAAVASEQEFAKRRLADERIGQVMGSIRDFIHWPCDCGSFDDGGLRSLIGDELLLEVWSKVIEPKIRR